MGRENNIHLALYFTATATWEGICLLVPYTFLILIVLLVDADATRAADDDVDSSNYEE